MYRQSLDPKYAAAIWMDMARIVSNLNRYSTEVVTPEPGRDLTWFLGFN